MVVFGMKARGLDRFFSSLYDRSVTGLALFLLSLLSVLERTSYPSVTERVIPSNENEAATQAQKQAKQYRDPAQPKGRTGRKAGSKNPDKTLIEWITELRILDWLLRKLVVLILHVLKVRYLVLDGQFGNNNTLKVVRQVGSLHLISKLRTSRSATPA